MSTTPFRISQAYQPGRSVVSILKDPAINNLFWNTSSSAWETYTVANVALYRIALTDPNGIGDYSAAFPTELAGKAVIVITYDTDNYTNPIGSALLSAAETAGSTSTTTSPSIVAVVNEALDKLGVTEITSLTEDSEAAEKAARVYNSIRKGLLRAHHWKFATYQGTLALLSGEEPMGYAYLYAYPSQCLMIRRVFDDNSTTYSDVESEVAYQEMLSPTTFVKSIACDSSPAYIEYTWDVTDPDVWDQNFHDCMVYLLAATLAPGLTGKTSLAKDYRDQAVAIISEAKRIDAREDNNAKTTTSTYVSARA